MKHLICSSVRDHPYRPTKCIIARALSIPGLLLVPILLLTAPKSIGASVTQEEKLVSLLGRMEKSYEQVNDYSATFYKHERIDGTLLPEESILLKFKKPMMIYLKWINEPNKEAIYVEGKDRNRVIAHSGASLTWKLDPNGSILIAGNRHPITDIGFGFMLKMMRENITTAMEHSEITVTKMEDTAFKTRKSLLVEATFNPKEGRKYYATRIVCHIDKELFLPIGIACYDENNELLEQYRYENVTINTGLTPSDFSRDNQDYSF